MKPHFDQHFLIDTGAIEKIAGFAEISGRRVLEIGPGGGSLTRALLGRGATVIAIEIDQALVQDLSLRFADELRDGSLQLIRGDATKCEYPPFDIVVANLPYSASSMILFRLLDTGFEVGILMFQKEFAQRMIARIGTPACGRLSVMAQTFANIKPLLQLPPAAFHPKPQVHSWVLRVVPRPPPFAINDLKIYAAVVRALFSHRRKTARNALKSSAGMFAGGLVTRAIENLPDDLLARRPEELLLEDFALIANVI